jgi:AcrR family transcriptional regulator
MTDTHDPIQELLVTARRNQILDAATQVFAEKGFHRATIKDIARTAGIADGTLYIYFASKTEVLLAILHRLNESTQREEHFALEGEQDIRAFFLAYIRQRMSLIWPNAEVFRAVLPELLVDAELRDLYFQHVVAPTLSVAEHAFQRFREQGQLREMDLPLAVRAIAGTFFGLLVLQLLGDQQIAEHWQELPELLTKLLYDGIGAEKDSSHDL